MEKDVQEHQEGESANVAFKEGIQAGFEMTKDVFQKMIVGQCQRTWWHRFVFCSCKKLLITVSNMTLELHVRRAGDNDLSDDEPIIVEGE